MNPFASTRRLLCCSALAFVAYLLLAGTVVAFVVWRQDSRGAPVDGPPTADRGAVAAEPDRRPGDAPKPEQPAGDASAAFNSLHLSFLGVDAPGRMDVSV